MKRILFLLVTALVVVTSSADNGHSAWMGDFLDMTASQVQGYWRANGYDFAVDSSLPSEGYTVKGTSVRGGSDIALLYASYELMRQKRCGKMHDAAASPKFKYRILNHWDNLDGSIERGYAGKSILH